MRYNFSIGVVINAGCLHLGGKYLKGLGSKFEIDTMMEQV